MRRERAWVPVPAGCRLWSVVASACTAATWFGWTVMYRSLFPVALRALICIPVRGCSGPPGVRRGPRLASVPRGAGRWGQDGCGQGVSGMGSFARQGWSDAVNHWGRSAQARAASRRGSMEGGRAVADRLYGSGYRAVVTLGGGAWLAGLLWRC